MLNTPSTKRKWNYPTRRLLFVWIVLMTILSVPASPSWAALSIADRPQPGQPDAITPDPTIQTMINAIDTATLTTMVGDLSGENSPTIDGEPYQFKTRFTTAAVPIAKATQYVYNYFAALNLPVQFQTWNQEGISGRNVVAEQAGKNTVTPCIYVVFAHVDSIVDSGDPTALAPGADDDASGSAAVLMLAKVLKNYNFGCTLRYVITTGEEQGLYGGSAYAQAAKAAGDPIRGGLNLDMIGYKTNTQPKFEMISRVGDPGIPDRLLSAMLKDVITAYNIDLLPVEGQSDKQDADHAAFWTAGFACILVIEDSTDLNPNYHKTTDALNVLNMAYSTKIVKAVAGGLAHLAGLVSQPSATRVFLPLTVAPGNQPTPTPSYGVEINQVIAGDPTNRVAQFVAGKNTVARAIFAEAVTLVPATTWVDILRDGALVTRLSPASTDRPVSTVEFLCPSLAVCGNWAAGTYTFNMQVNGMAVSRSGVVFAARAKVSVLAIPVKGCYKGGNAEAVIESLPDDQWKTFDRFTRRVYPVAENAIDWVTREEFDASDCARYDMYTDAGGKNLWDALTGLMPETCKAAPKAAGCYDLIVGFLSRNPKTDGGGTLAGFTYGKPTNIVTATDADAPATVSHEIAHVYGAGDTYKGGSIRCSVNRAYTGVTGDLWEGEANFSACTAQKHATIDAALIPAVQHPFEIDGRGALNSDMADYMGSSGKLLDFWTTQDVYQQLYKMLVPPAPQAAPHMPQRLVAMSGWINPISQAVTLQPWETFTGTLETPTAKSTYWVNAVDHLGVSVVTQTLEMNFKPPAARGDPTKALVEAPFEDAMPFPANVAAFRIMNGANQLASLAVSAHAPQVANVTAASISTNVFNVQWTGSDADGDPLTYRLEYSPDTRNPDADWIIVEDGLKNTDLPYRLDLTDFPGGSAYAGLRVIASDGVLSGEGLSAVFNVPGRAPYVKAWPPADGADYEAGDEVILEAEANDLQDQYLGLEPEISWRSDLSGALGVGDALVVSNLAKGTNHITAQATNSLGLKSTSAAIVIYIGSLSTDYVAYPANTTHILGNAFIAPISITVPIPAILTDTVISLQALHQPPTTTLPVGFSAFTDRLFQADLFTLQGEQWTPLSAVSGVTLTVSLPQGVDAARYSLFRYDAATGWRAAGECALPSAPDRSMPGFLAQRVRRLGQYALIGPSALLSATISKR